MINKSLNIILCIILVILLLCGFEYTKRVVLYVDPDTGVNYLVYAAGYKGGICPRYNSDGSLYINEIGDIYND